jgi:hypothetical protein
MLPLPSFRRFRVHALPLVTALLVHVTVACEAGQKTGDVALSSAVLRKDAGGGDLPDLPKRVGVSVVDLAGGFHADAVTAIPEKRLASTAMETPVYVRPDTSSPRLGVLRAGATVAMDPKVVTGAGCPGSFRQIKPMGYVCLGSDATLDLQNPIVRASTRRPDLNASLPYMYGTVKRGGPVYSKLPTEQELKSFEPHLASHIKKWSKDSENGAQYAPELWMRGRPKADPLADAGAVMPTLDPLAAWVSKATDADLPWFIRESATLPNLSGQIKGGAVKIGEVASHNGISFIDTVLWQGRRYGVTTDLRLLPTDRLRPIRGSEFHGFRIPEEVDFPFAIVRKKNLKRVRIEGGRIKANGKFPWRSTVKLTGHQRFVDGVLHYETSDGDLIEDRGASKVEVPKKMPGWAVNGERWIDINVTKQLLILYEGERPLFATLVSTGEAGLGDPETTKSTKRGIFRVHTKYLSTTMDSKAVGEEFELRDVPYVQYFQDGYALHAAYWHDVFGQPKSHGCINLAPEDARRIFFFTEPHVPEGWHGASKALTGTVVFIHE